MGQHTPPEHRTASFDALETGKTAPETRTINHVIAGALRLENKQYFSRFTISTEKIQARSRVIYPQPGSGRCGIQSMQIVLKFSQELCSRILKRMDSY